MTKKLFCGAAVIWIASAVLAGPASAVEDGFGNAREVQSEHFAVYYAPELDLSGLIQQLNISPSDELLAGKAIKKGYSLEGELAGMVDTLFTQVCGILDMQLYSFKGTIKICRDSIELNDIYSRFKKSSGKPTRSFYSYENNTVYTSPENFKPVIIGHEIAHAIISHYFVVLPSEKIQELLAQYVEFQLRKSGQ
ncbi:MAG: hypothetical protein PHE18_04710 [Candidatus Omnitrophica bacterium]|nr:hypothetical protein [Candidatus Omnitrophota bacterium]MDD5553161.1 hypothetical protein [Candidatus Omnitrophota bacterium]